MRFQNSRLRLKFLNLAINIHCMTASFLNGFKISDIDQLILALILHNILEWSKKLDVKFSRVFIRCKDILLNLNFFVFFFLYELLTSF